jgi:hypothetical protein
VVVLQSPLKHATVICRSNDLNALSNSMPSSATRCHAASVAPSSTALLWTLPRFSRLCCTSPDSTTFLQAPPHFSRLRRIAPSSATLLQAPWSGRGSWRCLALREDEPALYGRAGGAAGAMELEEEHCGRRNWRCGLGGGAGSAGAGGVEAARIVSVCRCCYRMSYTLYKGDVRAGDFTAATLALDRQCTREGGEKLASYGFEKSLGSIAHGQTLSYLNAGRKQPCHEASTN